MVSSEIKPSAMLLEYTKFSCPIAAKAVAPIHHVALQCNMNTLFHIERKKVLSSKIDVHNCIFTLSAAGT